MARSKLRKYETIKSLDNVIDVDYETLKQSAQEYTEKLQSFLTKFKRVVVELGCGYGEYTVELAEQDDETLYIGVDIKGDRIHQGAKSAIDQGLDNTLFIRSQIQNIESLFEPDSVDAIWVTFPDPRPKTDKRKLIHSDFTKIYHKLLKTGGKLILKTDSDHLWEYIGENEPEGYSEYFKSNNIDLKPLNDIVDNKILQQARSIKTRYENKFRDLGSTIKLLILKKS